MKIFVCFRSAIFIALLFFTIISASACAAAGPWKGRVVDIETNEPLEGAAVVAVWDRVYRTPAGRSHYFYESKETQTDKTGAFEIEAYTPINLLSVISEIEGPTFIIFKPGYLSINRPIGEYLLEGSTKGSTELEEFSFISPTRAERKKFRLSAGLVELPRLTREERLNSIGSSYLSGVPENKNKLLIELRDQEAIEIGLEPLHKKGAKK